MSKNVAATRADIDEVLEVLQNFISQVDTRFTKIEQDILGEKTSMNSLVNTIDGFIGRIDKYETELAARDHKIMRLENWLTEISKVTGVKAPI